jgi:hypothetical protein
VVAGTKVREVVAMLAESGRPLRVVDGDTVLGEVGLREVLAVIAGEDR